MVVLPYNEKKNPIYLLKPGTAYIWNKKIEDHSIYLRLLYNDN